MTANKTARIVDNRFRIDEEIGSGGFGHVFKAEDQAFNRTVAVKILDVVDPSDTDAQARFEREAKVLSSLQHPHIVTVYNYGTDDRGRPYLSMNYLEGETLRHVLRRDGKLNWKRAASIFIQICDALSAAHKEGVVHRDMKPENIMLLREPQPDYVKVLDFGLSGYVFGAEGAVQRLTRTGALVGTALYMSPEVCQGARADARSDVYSLGCVLYESIAGKPPLCADDPMRVLYQHLHEMPERLNGVPPAMESVCFKAMQKNADDRFQSMEEFSQALNTVLAGKQLTLGSVKFAEQKPVKRISSLVVSIVVGLAVIVIPAAVLWMTKPPQNAAQIWATEQDLGNVHATRHEIKEAIRHYQTALAAAQTQQQRYDSELQIGKWLLDPGMYDPERKADAEALKVLGAAVKDAGDPHQAEIAQTLLGIAHHELGQAKEAHKVLLNQPWNSLAYSNDMSLRNATYWKARAQQAYANKCPPAKPPDTKLYVDGAFWTFWNGSSAVNEDLPQADLLTVCTNLKQAVRDGAGIEEALEGGNSILERTRDNKRLQAMLTTLLGVACCKTHLYDRAVQYLDSRPWLLNGEPDRDDNWCYDGKLAAGISYLMCEKPDPNKALSTLEPLVGDYMDRSQFGFMYNRADIFRSIAMLENGKAVDDNQLAVLLSKLGWTLDKQEAQYVKGVLASHKMPSSVKIMDRWDATARK